MLTEKLAEGLLLFKGIGFHQRQRLLIKAQNIADHAPKLGAKQITALGKQAVEVIAIVFQPGIFTAHTKAHIRCFCLHAELFHQANKIGIGPVVIHNETGVHRQDSPINFHRLGVSMPTNVVIGFIHMHVVLTAKQIGAGQAGDTATNDCDFLLL